MVDVMGEDVVLPPRVAVDRSGDAERMITHGGVPVDWALTIEAVRQLAYKLAVGVRLMVECRDAGLVPAAFKERVDGAITEASSIGSDMDRVMGKG